MFEPRTDKVRAQAPHVFGEECRWRENTGADALIWDILPLNAKDIMNYFSVFNTIVLSQRFAYKWWFMEENLLEVELRRKVQECL